jgi:hypothetical protein
MPSRMNIPTPEQISKNPTIRRTTHFLIDLVWGLTHLASQMISVGSEADWISIY